MALPKLWNSNQIRSSWADSNGTPVIRFTRRTERQGCSFPHFFPQPVELFQFGKTALQGFRDFHFHFAAVPTVTCLQHPPKFVEQGQRRPIAEGKLQSRSNDGVQR